MALERFKIVSPKDGQSVDNIFETLLINTDHIVSLKPIKMVVDEKLVLGYWIRTTNGKKYRAVEIPELLKVNLGATETDISTTVLNVLSDDLSQTELMN
ncbi:MAG: hypothetical protein HOP07_12135 [Bacteriovoracaceae bacterium]|nr:hypothetical protein [Bacteriovoracaceae bacterium]